MSHNPPAHEFPVGHIFEGKYKILRELGRGGFGMVYLGYQESMDRQVALKVLKGGATGEHAGARERFIREVKIIAKLKHPNTVTIHEFGETIDGALYMVLEFVEGEELKQVLKRDGPQDPLRVCTIARQISKSLAEAHRHGVVHRDLKPANIMLTRIEGEEDFVKVLDFGVARLLDPKTADLTSVGLPEGERELIGTPRYMSPEQVRGESLTGSSDIYSLGLMMYEMLSGEPAVQGDTTMALITQQISPEPLRLWGLEHQDPLVQDIVRIATSKALSDRFQTAEQMGDALEQAIFNTRRARNLTGSGSGDFSGQLQTGFNQFQQGPSQFHDPSGFHPNPSGWTAQQPQQSFNPSGFQPQQGVDPRSSGQWGQQQGFDPRATGAGFDPRSTGSGFDPRSTGSGFDRRLSGQQPAIDPRLSGQQPAIDPRTPGSGQHPQFNRSSGQFGSLDPNAPFQQNDPQLDIDVDINDFQPTIERSALSRDSMPSFSELPPVQDEDPFAPEPQEVPRPRPTGAQTAVAPPEDDDLVEYSIDVIKILILSLTTAIGVYASFLVIGAGLIVLLEDAFLRIVATGVLCAGIPLFTALGENSQKERFRVLEKPRSRLIRILIGTTIFSTATGLLVGIAMADTVVRELRTDPNWYFTEVKVETESGLPELNRKASYAAADVVEWTASALGLHNPINVPEGGEVPGRMPAPTRHKVDGKSAKSDAPTKAGETSAGSAGPADTHGGDGADSAANDNDPGGEQPEKTPPPDGSEPAGEVEGDDDYVRW